MRGVNKVILIGNVGQDPEVEHMPSGGAVTNISVATTERWKDKNTGQVNEKTEWHRIVFFNKLAEIAGEYLRKGAKVYLEGSLRTRKWQNSEGKDQYTTEIVASEMQMLDGKSESNGPNRYQQQYQPAQQQQYQQQQYQQPRQQNQGSAQNGGHQQGNQFDDEEIPFSPIGLQYGKRSVLAM